MYKRYLGGLTDGFTLVEVLLATAILGFTAAGITTAFIAGNQQNYYSVRSTVAVNLAQALFDEILAHPFTDPLHPGTYTEGPDAGETRATYNNVADYDGLQEPAGSLQGPDGQPLNDPTFSGYSRSVTAAYVYLPGQDQSAPPTFILVTVEVKYNGMSMARLSRLVSSGEDNDDVVEVDL